MVGHSMGALHSWCLAAARPELVDAVVVEDMAPDFRGRTTGPWEPWVHALPVEFGSAEQIYAEFGPVAGQYFLEAFDRTATGWRLHGHPEKWIEIAAEWGTRDYWDEWQAVAVPTLLLEAGGTVTPPGQMRRMAEMSTRARYLHVPGDRNASTTPRGNTGTPSRRSYRRSLEMPEPGQLGCSSKRVRMASTSCCTR
jgi:pimeloyl-ACP methyl ester carboxylesterase